MKTKNSIETPRLNLHIYTNGESIQRIHLSSSSEGLSFHFIGFPSFQLKDSVKDWISKYLNREEALPLLPLDWTSLSPFTLQVLAVMKTIPFGQVLSYGEVASLLHKKGGARAVGNACGRNPFPFIIPCHRIVGAHNTWGGYTGGLEIKKELLRFENNSYAAALK